MRLRWLTPLLVACSIPAGTPHQVKGTVRETSGSTLLLEHEALPGVLEGTETRFTVDPNLSRRVHVGDAVTANLLVPPDGGPPRLIGFEARATTEP